MLAGRRARTEPDGWNELQTEEGQTMKTEKMGLLERSRRNKPMMRARFKKILEEFGITGGPIPVREL